MRVLVIAPHPDDEAIGMGGTIRKHVVEGDYVHILYLTSGEYGCPGVDATETAITREREVLACRDVLGFADASFFRYRDGSFEDNEKTRQQLTAHLLSLEIDLVYGPHRGEKHNDHNQAAWMLHNTDFPWKRVYEISSPLQEHLHVVDITPYATDKHGAIRAYKSQIANNNYAEGMLALNHYRGLLHGPNMMYAEVFA